MRRESKVESERATDSESSKTDDCTETELRRHSRFRTHFLVPEWHVEIHEISVSYTLNFFISVIVIFGLVLSLKFLGDWTSSVPYFEIECIT